MIATLLTLPGPLRYAFMQNAYAVGAIVAVVAAVVGFFVVLRQLSFAGHALAHVGFSGAAGAVWLGIDPLIGLVAFTLTAGFVMGALGERARNRDVAIGVVLAFSVGLGVLFLKLYTKRYASEVFSILFGTILGVSHHDVAVTLLLGLIALTALAVLYRPLLFASIDPEVAAARGVPVRGLSVAFLLVLALAVAQAVQVVGVLLIFVLLVAPPAAAQYVVRRPRTAILVAVVFGVGSTWAGITLAYYFQRAPVSFFIASLSCGLYLLARLAAPFVPQHRAFGDRLGIETAEARLPVTEIRG
jgi:zinc/manganese transport system permease protein